MGLVVVGSQGAEVTPHYPPNVGGWAESAPRRRETYSPMLGERKGVAGRGEDVRSEDTPHRPPNVGDRFSCGWRPTCG